MKRLIILAIIAIFLTANHGATKQEKYECERWKQQADLFEGFYLSAWQFQQCSALGFEFPESATHDARQFLSSELSFSPDQR